MTLRVMISRLIATLRTRRRDAELSAEIQAHLDALTDDYVRRGMSLANARAAARREFGGVAQLEETYRDQRGWPFLDTLMQDVRYGLRTLRKNRGFTVVAVLTLALGIGANTAIFSLIDAVMLRWLPVHEPQRLVQVTLVRRTPAPLGGSPVLESFSYPLVRGLAGQRDLFSGLFGVATTSFVIGRPDALESTPGAWVSGEYYDTLGLVPVAGRLLRPDDDRAGAVPAAVISDGYWERKFGRDGRAVGDTILVEGTPVTIVGVSPPGFTGTIVGDVADVTIALAAVPQLLPERASFLEASSTWLRILGRPQPGLSVAQANARLAVVWPPLVTAAVPASMPGARRRNLESAIQLRPGATGATNLREQFQQPLTVLMTVVGLVLALGCANVANLLLARAAARRREIAVRLAIGADRFRIVRQLLTESALLSLAGGALGIAFAWWGSRFLVDLLSNGQSEGVVLDLTPNGHVLAFTSLVAMSTMLLFGVAPAFRATTVDPAAAMSAGSSRIAASTGRVGPLLVTAQVAISLLLVIGAGLFVRTLQNLRTLDRGFRHEGVLIVDVDGRRAGFRGPRLRAFAQDLLATVERIPGVTTASFSSVLPLTGGGISFAIAVNGVRTGPEEAYFNNVSARYFETMRTPVVLGREFNARDDASAPGVAIVNEAFVQRYMPGLNPLAQRVSILSGSGDLQVVGVVKDAAYMSLREPIVPTVYAPYLQRGSGPVTIEVYAPGALAPVASAVRAAIQPMVPGTPVKVRLFTEQLERSLVQERLMATLAASFGALAIVLAVVGLYGLLAYNVAQRTNEIGVRIALGAHRWQVLWLVMNDAVRTLAIGAAFGLPAAWAASRFISSMLYGLRPTDAITMAAATAVLMTAGLFAGFLSARRAANVDPMVALRHE